MHKAFTLTLVINYASALKRQIAEIRVAISLLLKRPANGHLQDISGFCTALFARAVSSCRISQPPLGDLLV
jgi:hypothetical protein